MSGPFIKFVEVDFEDGRKTKVWAVLTIDGRECLGRIAWYCPWRRYCYIPTENVQVILELVCLRMIADYCESQTKAHKQQRLAVTP